MTRMSSIVMVLLLLGLTEPGRASSSLLMPDRSSILVGGEDGQLQLWAPSETKPRWQLRIGGTGVGARSRVAAVAVRPNGDILLVERYGDILLIAKDGRVISRYTPIYEYVRLKVDVANVDWSKWQEQIDVIAHTSASSISDDARYLYLVPDEWSVVRKIAVDDLLQQPSGLVMLTDTLIFQFKDKNITIDRKLGPPKVNTGKGWPVGEERATSLAVCDGLIVAGTEKGAVYFIPEDGDQQKDQRVRQVGNPENDIRSILDAVCVGAGAATVSFDAGNGQIQLWDLHTKAATGKIGFDNGGHPGMAFAATPSRSGDYLLSLGDGDLRLWAVKDGKLQLVAKYFPDSFERQQNFAAVALTPAAFVFWDGRRLIRIGVDKTDQELYAGPKM